MDVTKQEWYRLMGGGDSEFWKHNAAVVTSDGNLVAILPKYDPNEKKRRLEEVEMFKRIIDDAIAKNKENNITETECHKTE
jgi:hypothetical protein